MRLKMSSRGTEQPKMGSRGTEPQKWVPVALSHQKITMNGGVPLVIGMSTQKFYIYAQVL